MAVTLRPPHIDIPDTPLIEVASDLDRRGRLGQSRLVATNEFVHIYETTSAGELEVGRYTLDSIKNPTTEQLVDAYSILATVGGKQVELLRSTNARTVLLSDAAKRLELLIEDKPLPTVSVRIENCPKCGRPLGEDSKICPYCIDRRRTLVRLFEYAKPYKKRLIWGTLVTFGATFLQLIPPKLTQLLLDDVFTKHETSKFLGLLIALGASILLANVVSMARLRNTAYVGMGVSSIIRNSLFSKIQELSLNFYDKRSVGSLMSRMINDTSALYDVLVDGIPVLLNLFARLIGVPIAMFIMNPVIAPWALLPVPFVLVAVSVFRKRMTSVWSRFWHSWSRFGSSLNGVLQGSRVVKAFYSEKREINRFHGRIVNLAKTQYTAESSWATFFPIIVFTMSLSSLMVYWIGGKSVLQGTLSVGQLIAFVAYVALLQDPLMNMQRIIDWSTKALTAAERVFEILDTPVTIADSPNAQSIPNIQGAVEFKGVHFGYDKSREVLHGIDFKVKAGEIIGVVGPSGAGKSTLINLLLRFYDPTRGTIELDGIDLTQLKLADFRRQVGVVLQESYLFPGSVRHNIGYGRPDATLEDIIVAAKAANAHHFVVNFPDGYDSYVGERGQRLSGGERQRIAIARAILYNPKVLILDEATASVDTETEQQIQQALDRLIEGRTVFAIAHRLSTLRNADRLIVLEDGKIAEIGTHEELLKLDDGVYRRLLELQQEAHKINDNFFVE